jgi:hypothetical protein
MKRLLSISILLTLLFSPGVANAATYKNCSALNAKFANGVAKSKSAASKQKFAPKVSASIYKTHRKLDKDNDGTVCEKTKGSSSSPTNTIAAQTFSMSQSWGEISIPQVAGPAVGSCVEIPVTLDVRSQSGLFYGLIVSGKDYYNNQVGEARPNTPVGVHQVPIRVCREAWTFTFPNGVTSPRAATLYCGVKFTFWPSVDVLEYRFRDSSCVNSSSRLP